MADTITLILIWMHVFFIVGWFGSFLYAFFVLFPLLRKLTPPTAKEMVVTLLPPHEGFGLIFATGAIVSGGALFLDMRAGASSTWIGYMVPGLILGLVAYVLLLVATQGMRRMRRAVGASVGQTLARMPAPPQGMLIGMVLSFVFLTAAFTFMVLAATFA